MVSQASNAIGIKIPARHSSMKSNMNQYLKSSIQLLVINSYHDIMLIQSR